MTIFVAGIHGVGKTYLCKKYVEHRDVTHATASALIREELASPNWGVDKLVGDIDGNQIALIRAVERYRSNQKRLLLDGHFVLKDKQQIFVPLDPRIFSLLGIRGVALVEAPSDVIQRRLASRDGSSSIMNIEAFLDSERNHATQVCTNLNVPLFILNSPSEKEFSSRIDKC